jgi:hypothetical protein
MKNAVSSLLLETLLSGQKKVNIWTGEDNFIWTDEDVFIWNRKISVSGLLKTVLFGLI